MPCVSSPVWSRAVIYCCPGKIKSTSTYAPIIRFPDDKQLMGAYSKVPKGRETTDGGITPGSSATTKEAPTGRQSFNMLFTKQLDVLPPLWGFRFVDVPVPGVLPFGQAQADNTPVCGLSRLRRFSRDSNNNL